MGMRGPAKKPTEIELLHGSPGRRGINGTLKFERSAEIPKPPPFLDAVSKKEWKRLAPLLHRAGVITEADTAVFSAYCASYSQWIAAEKAIQAKKPNKNAPAPLTFTTDKGYEQQIPEIGIANSAKKQMLVFARELGLTPSARASMNNPLETEDNKTSIMEFIGRNHTA